MSVCARLCRTRQNRRDTTADDLKNQSLSHQRQRLGHSDCCCRARRSPPAPRFPHRLRPAPRGFLLGRFSNAGRCRSQPEPSRRGPHRKTFTVPEVRVRAHYGARRPLCRPSRTQILSAKDDATLRQPALTTQKLQRFFSGQLASAGSLWSAVTPASPRTACVRSSARGFRGRCTSSATACVVC